jgi:hypothetical protein
MGKEVITKKKRKRDNREAEVVAAVASAAEHAERWSGQWHLDWPVLFPP